MRIRSLRPPPPMSERRCSDRSWSTCCCLCSKMRLRRTAHRLGFVLVLAFFVLALHDDARGQVRDADGAFGFVDLLTARAAGPHRVDLQVFVADVDFDLGHFGQDGDGGRAGVDAALGLGLGDALHAMPAALELQLLEGRFARDGKDDFLQAAQLGRS